MTYEESQLLYKDLCGRVPYGVKYHWKGRTTEDELPHVLGEINNWMIYYIHEGFVKPYLRPMSSMTEEEEKEFNEIIGYKGVNVDGWEICDKVYTMYGIYLPGVSNLIDWLLAHYFDYRGLIKKGLALEAPEGMYDE